MADNRYYESDELNAREMAILKELNCGHTDKIIARKLHISPSTVNFYLRSLYKKLGVNKRKHAVVIAQRQKLIS